MSDFNPESSEPQWPTFKLLLVGEMGVGKSTFIKRLMSEPFCETYVTTPSLDMTEIVFFTNQGAIQFNIVDGLAGITDPAKKEEAYRGGQCAIIMFDVTSPMSYRRVPLWHRDLKKACDEIPMVMCANKVDREDRKVKMEQLRSDLPCFELSVKRDQDVQSPFLAISRMMLSRAGLSMISAPKVIPKSLAGETKESKRNSVKKFKELMEQYYAALAPEEGGQKGDAPGRLTNSRLSVVRPPTTRQSVARMNLQQAAGKVMAMNAFRKPNGKSLGSLSSDSAESGAAATNITPAFKQMSGRTSLTVGGPPPTSALPRHDNKRMSIGRRGSMGMARLSMQRSSVSLPGQVTPGMVTPAMVQKPTPPVEIASAAEYQDSLRRKSLMRNSEAAKNKRKSVTVVRPPVEIATEEEFQEAVRKSMAAPKDRSLSSISAISTSSAPGEDRSSKYIKRDSNSEDDDDEDSSDEDSEEDSDEESDEFEEVDDDADESTDNFDSSNDMNDSLDEQEAMEQEIVEIVGMSTAVVEFKEAPNVEAVHAAVEIGNKTHLAVSEAERDDIELLNSLDDDEDKATVFGGEWYGTSVAVKFIRCSSKEEVELLYKELAAVSVMHHPRLVAIMAVCKDLDPSEGTLALLTEFMDRGSLFSILHDASPAAAQYRPKTMLQKIRLCTDIVAAMRFLKNHRVTHSNLKSNNILIDHEGRPKIADFGTKSLNSYALGKARTLAWTAPEVIRGSETDEKSDVYSVGVIIWEIFTGSIPWEDMTNDEVKEMVIAKEQRLPVPEEGKGVPTTMLNLIVQCFGPPSQRMTFDELAKTLKDIESAEKANPTDKEESCRLSNDTMHQQLQFLRSKFLKGEEDELEWLMVSKEPGAYKYAHGKLGEAEDRYYKSLAEMDSSEQKIESTSDLIAKCSKQFNDCVNVKAAVESGAADAQNKVKIAQKALQGLITMDALNPDQGLPSVLTYFTQQTRTDLMAFVDEKDLKKAVSIADNLKTKALPEEKKNVQRQVAQLQKDSDLALKDMERWTKREKECDDYSLCMAKEEQEWQERERKRNEECLAIMRSYVPLGVQNMTTEELKAAVLQKHGMFSAELLLEIKKNKCLHWFITHTQDIAMSNFLMGDLKQYFENLEGMDVIELRALACVVPEKFELDGDGRKQDWRSRMMAKVKMLASQEAGEEVSGSWDTVKGERMKVKLPPLKPNQERRQVFFYPTKAQCDLKVKQYNEKQAQLEKKQAALAVVEGEALEAKTEYDIILVEMRDQDIKNTYGTDQLMQVKDMAKQQLADLNNKKKKLEGEVQRIDKQIRDNPQTKEEFEQSVEDLRKFLQRKGVDYFNAKTPVKIDGVFEKNPTVTKAKREVAKMLSPEEEAAMRKKEIEASTRQRVPSTVEEADDSEGNVSPASREIRKLSNANLAMAGRLKGMFPDQDKKGGTNFSKGSPKKGGLTAIEEKKPEPPKVTKVSRSKLLLKFMEDEQRNSETETSGPPKGGPFGGGGGMSMLDQIKAKKALGAGGGGGPPGAGMSMMDQIKAKKAGKGGAPGGGGGGPMSMMDMIKSKRKE